jgi:amino acid transporter
MKNEFIELFVQSWLAFTLVNIIYNIVIVWINRIKGKVTKEFDTLSVLFSVQAGLSLAIVIGTAFAGNNAALFIVNGKSAGTVFFSIAAVLFFAVAGYSGADYGGRFFSRALVFAAKKCFNRNFRQENKMTGTQKTMKIFSIIGIIAMALFYLSFVDFKMTFSSLLLWCYIPVFGACSGLAFAVPVIFLVKAYSGKWENGKWVNKESTAPQGA